jgi:uncharacterized protein
MKQFFADAHYWIAASFSDDMDHTRVQEIVRDYAPVMLHTSDEVLTEFLTYASGKGAWFRENAVQTTRHALQNPDIIVWPQTRARFLQALELYDARRDKGYSLVDCNSMVLMRRQDITDVLTRDRHFEQEGFNVLIEG